VSNSKEKNISGSNKGKYDQWSDNMISGFAGWHTSSGGHQSFKD
jgi:hypothetical protein